MRSDVIVITINNEKFVVHRDILKEAAKLFLPNKPWGFRAFIRKHCFK